MGSDSHGPWVCPKTTNQLSFSTGVSSPLQQTRTAGIVSSASTRTSGAELSSKKVARHRQRKLTGVDDLALATCAASQPSLLAHARNRYRSTTALPDATSSQLPYHNDEPLSGQNSLTTVAIDYAAAANSRGERLFAPASTAFSASGELYLSTSRHNTTQRRLASRLDTTPSTGIVLSLHNSQHLSSGYSSGSQAHLQSLVSDQASSSGSLADDTAHQYRSQLLLASSKLNESSTSRNLQHRQPATGTLINSRTANVPSTELKASSSANSTPAKLLPPPYSLVAAPTEATAAATQTLPNVICRQPTASATYPHPMGEPANQASLAAGSGAGLAAASSTQQCVGRQSGAIVGATTNAAVGQQQLLGFLAANQVPQSTAAAAPPSSFPGTLQFQLQHPGYLPPHYHQHQHPRQMPTTCLGGGGGSFDASTAAAATNSACRNQQQQQQQQQQFQYHHPPLLNATKSKSCLTCVDISIKWYIVVIALLGLICALVGTIVGAVHSGGRDYISLALLLLGVGLVLVSISWIAIRITVKTYQATRLGRSHHHRLTTPIIRPARVARMLAGPSSSSLQRSLINERLYLMAAAATALSSASSLRPPVLIDSAASSPPTEESGGAGAGTVGLLAGIKQSISRQFASLARYTSLGTMMRSNSAPEAGPSVANNGGRSRLVVGDVLPNTLDASHLAAILHHYQYNPALPMNPSSVAATAAAMGFILEPNSAQLAHQHLLASLVDDPFLRQPPPSYTASMQDNRMRRILQERAGIQQALAQQSSSSASTRPQQQQQQPSSQAILNPSSPHPGSSWTLQSNRQPGTARVDLKQTNTGTPSSVSVANDIYEPATPESRCQQQTPTQANHTRSKSQVKILGYV